MPGKSQPGRGAAASAALRGTAAPDVIEGLY
jgi:hypothetical protein